MKKLLDFIVESLERSNQSKLSSPFHDRIINCYFHEILFWSVVVVVDVVFILSRSAVACCLIWNHISFIIHRLVTAGVLTAQSNHTEPFVIWVRMIFDFVCKNIFITNWCCPAVNGWLREFWIDFDVSLEFRWKEFFGKKSRNENKSRKSEKFIIVNENRA